MIRFEQVSKIYAGGHVAVRSLDLTIKQGEFFVLIGPSGSGKTTTLKMINRLIPLTSGQVWIQDKKISDYDIHELRWSIGYVLQQIALFPHMTIAENIAVVPELKGWPKVKINQRIDELLDMVGLEPSVYRHRKPNELSGGQQQRIGVLRALAADPEILLMDEPFSALDPFTREKLQDDLLELQRKINKTIVFVTHDMQEAMKLGDRICLMKDGEIVQTGTPAELLQRPANDYVKQFMRGVKPSLELTDLLLPLSIQEKELLQPLSEHERALLKLTRVPVATPIHEVLDLLSRVEELLIEDNGEVVGSITRPYALGRLADIVKERGYNRE